MSIDINFTDDDWERIRRDWTSWWDGDIDRPMVMIENVNTLMGANDELSEDFLLHKPVDEVIDYFQARLETGNYYGESWPRYFPNFGPGFMAAFLDAKVVPMPDQHTVWFEAKEQVPIDRLHFAYDPDSVWWKRIQDITRTAVERWGDRVSMAHTDLGGNADILASFRTSNQLLLDLYDAPEEVLRLTGEITDLWKRYYDELYEIIKPCGRGTSNWAGIWSPERTYMTQSDFCYMISPAMFEKFVLPDLSSICGDMTHGFYHLDGKGQIPHLDMLLSLDSLAGIQWIPGGGQPPTEEWMPLLKRIIDGGKRCQVFVTTEGARRIVREIGGKGFAFYILAFPMTAEDAANFIKTLADEDIGKR